MSDVSARLSGGGTLASARTFRRYGILATLTLVYTLNLVDRGLMMLLLQPIKEDLHLSDTQLGFITGIAFGLFYAVLGVPIARWSDRGNRATITSLAIALWGATVVSMLFVTTYLHLVVARIAAAIGESGCKPPAYSLVGDYFPEPAERTRAMAIFMVGSPLSTLVSLGLGGVLNEIYGWRGTFAVMAIPAVLLALLVKLTVPEPRALTRVASSAGIRLPAFTKVLGVMWRQRSSRHLIAALVLVYMMTLGMAPWYASFLARSHGMSTAELGVWLGLILSLGGMTGVLVGGYIGSRWYAGNAQGHMRLCAITLALVLPFLVAFLTLRQKQAALLALIPLFVSLNVFLGPSYALMQRLVPDDMRATMMSVVMLFANLIGFGMGPQLVGLMSDGLRPLAGVDSLRYALLAMSFVAVWAAWHFWRAGRTVEEDLARGAVA